MSISEMNLTINPETSAHGVAVNRLLGIFALVGAPMLLLFLVAGADQQLGAGGAKTLKAQLFATLGVLYIAGWLAGAVGLRRVHATGDRLGAKIVFIIQIVLLSFALMFSVMEVAGYTYESGGLIFAVFDAGWPLSHLMMNVVGIFVLRAKVWKNFARFAPFFVGAALPVTLAVMATGAQTLAGFVFGILTTAGLGIIGRQLLKS